MKIAFLCGGLGISGGNYVVIQHALFLQEKGHDVALITLFEKENFDLTWHTALQKIRIINMDQLIESFDLLIATWWRTAYHLSQIKAKKYAYFVQSIESRFHEVNAYKLAHYIEGTYFFGLPVITEASWIVKYLEEKTTTNFIELVRNGVRKDLYSLTGPTLAPREPGRLRVLVEGPMDLFFKNVPKTIELCRKSDADEIWLLTSTQINHYKGVDKVFSQVPIDKTAEIYRSCDVIVKLSYVEGMFGPPLEMFHCGGTALVYDVTGHDEYIQHEQNALVVMRDDEEAVIDYLNALKKDRNLLARLQAGAIATAQLWPGWSVSSTLFETALLNLPEQSESAQQKLRAIAGYINYFYYLSDSTAVTASAFRASVKRNLKKIPALYQGMRSTRLLLKKLLNVWNAV